MRLSIYSNVAQRVTNWLGRFHFRHYDLRPCRKCVFARGDKETPFIWIHCECDWGNV